MTGFKRAGVSVVALSGVMAGLFAGGPVLSGQTAPQPNMATAASNIAATAPLDSRCAALASVALDKTEIVSASYQPEKAAVSGAYGMSMSGGKGPPLSGLPAFCRVVLRGHPEAGSDVLIEVWLPANGWNGRYHAVGNGGFAGSINYADMARAIAGGMASSSTDTGHQAGGGDGSWAKGRPELIRDFGWRGVHEMTVNAKKFIAAYYGKPADKSYFMSCSNGGRQALMEASRFPADFDGIVAGAPASQFSRLGLANIWAVQAQLAQGAALRPEQAKFLSAEITAQCDARDGQVDGLIDDPRQCRIDFTKMQCGAASSPMCLSAPQVLAMQKIAKGPPRMAGLPKAYAYSLTGSLAGKPAPGLGWEGWIMMGGKTPPMVKQYPDNILANFTKLSGVGANNFDWKRHPALLKGAMTDIDAQPNMRRYFNRGGKLIIWHGWADGAIPAEQTIGFYQDILRQSGAQAKRSVKLFMIPEMQHCFGGNGAAIFGQIAPSSQDILPERSVARAMQAWVEQGRVPISLVGRKSMVPSDEVKADEKQRLHCAYPASAKLKAGGNGDVAADYVCQIPKEKRG